MTEFLIVVGVVILLFALLLVCNAIDNWHKRYAWRNARRHATRFMKMRNGEPPI